MTLRLWLFALAACGPRVSAPPTPVPTAPAPAPNGVALDVFDTTPTAAYRACFTGGHVSLQYGDPNKEYRLAFDADRDSSAADVRTGGVSWRIGNSTEGDLTQELTIDGRFRDELPQMWARGEAASPIFVSSSGLDRAEFTNVLGHLQTAGSHRVGAFHLSLPPEAVFESIRFESSQPDITVPGRSSEEYGAGFSRKSYWVQQAPWGTLAGAPFWFAPYAQPTNPHTGLPTIPAWHGEATIGTLVLSIDAVGTVITEARYRQFATAVIEAALRGGDASCRTRSGHMGV